MNVTVGSDGKNCNLLDENYQHDVDGWGALTMTSSKIDDVTVENFSRYIIYDSERGVVNESSELVVACVSKIGAFTPIYGILILGTFFDTSST